MGTTKSVYDVILVGNGHQGLIAANYLAKSGFSVAVFGAKTPHPETDPYKPFYENSVMGPCAHLPVHINSAIAEDLKLSDYGLDAKTAMGHIVIPSSEGGYATISGNKQINRNDAANISDEEVAVFLELHKNLHELAQIFDQLDDTPNYTQEGWKDLWSVFETGKVLASMPDHLQVLFSKIMKNSLQGFLEDTFKSKLLQSFLALQTSLCTFSDPSKEGSAVTLLEYIMSVGHEAPLYEGNWQPLRGSTHPLLSALRDSALSFGVDFVEGDENLVNKILFDKNKHCEGVLSGDQEIKAQLVLVDTSPVLLFNNLIDDQFLNSALTTRFARAKDQTPAQSFVRLKCVLDKMPTFKALEGQEISLNGEVHLCQKLEDLSQSFKEAKIGTASTKPVLSVIFPGQSTSDLSTGGNISCSILAQYFSPQIAADVEKNEDLIATILDTANHFAPDFKESVVGTQLITGNALDYGIGALSRDFATSGVPLLRLFNGRLQHHGLQSKHGFSNVFLCGYGAEASSLPHLINNGYSVAKFVQDTYQPRTKAAS